MICFTCLGEGGNGGMGSRHIPTAFSFYIPIRQLAGYCEVSLHNSECRQTRSLRELKYGAVTGAA